MISNESERIYIRKFLTLLRMLASSGFEVDLYNLINNENLHHTHHHCEVAHGISSSGSKTTFCTSG